MIDYYTTDNQHIYTGAVQIDPYAPLPPGTITPPPVTTGNEVAQWTGVDWVVLPERPALPEPPPKPTPRTCTPAQGYVALFALKGITKQMLYEAVDQIPDPVQKYMAQIGLEHTGEWKRDSATMQAMAQLLSLTEQDLDDLFLYAKNVEV